jgi:hypothetical protein
MLSPLRNEWKCLVAARTVTIGGRKTGPSLGRFLGCPQEASLLRKGLQWRASLLDQPQDSH